MFLFKFYTAEISKKIYVEDIFYVGFILGGDEQPDLLILDEPTNNLEIKSIGILEDALNQYRGAILLVSHDEMFAKNINVDDMLCL